MGTITSGVGLVSGLNTTDIINQLMSLEQKPVTDLQARIDDANKQKLAFTDLQTQLTSLRLYATTLKKPSSFTAAKATSSNEAVLTATTTGSPTPGTYTFQVAQLVTTQQSVTNGFADYTSPLASTSPTLTVGTGALKNTPTLAQLNGGAGVAAGVFKITNRAGAGATIDTTGLTTLDQVVAKINATSLKVTASISDQGLVLKDASGGTGDLAVTQFDSATTAHDLGIDQSVSANTITGTSVNSVGTASLLASLNDGLGIHSSPGNDFKITFSDSSSLDIDLGNAKTLGDVVSAINSAPGSKISASINSTTNSLQLTDTSGLGGSFSVSSINGSKAASDLGILGTASGSLNGATLSTNFNTVKVSSLNGGKSLTLGSFNITNNAGTSSTIDLSSAKTVQDVLDTINGSGLPLTATLTTAGNAIQILDKSSGSAGLTISDADGTKTATQLGLAGTTPSTTGKTATGQNLGLAQVSSGVLTFEMGGGDLSSTSPLSKLNGGAGVTRGSFRITDASGQSSIVDISSAVTLDDVVNKINTSLNTSVRASVSGQGLVISDLSGGSGTLKIADVNGGTTAKSLGIAGAAAVGDTKITGTAISYLGRSTLLSDINDARGVRTATGADFRITLSDSSNIDVDLGSATTIGQTLDAINTAGAGKVIASVSSDGRSIKLTDNTGSSGFSVSALNGATTASDLGILGSTATNTLTGNTVIAGLNTVLLSSLNGGKGLTLGAFTLTDRSGTSASVDLTGSSTVQDVLDKINSAGTGLTASLNSSGNGIQLVDNSAGTGLITVLDNAGSSVASDLGISGAYDFSNTSIQGANLQRQWVTENSLLSNYNGGKGVNLGSFKITNAKGLSTTVDLSTGTFTRLSDVIKAINAKSIGVTASINANGDGLLLTDNSGGAGHLKVEDVSGTSASDLQIAGTSTSNTLDGSFEKTIALTSEDTLATVQTKINSLNFGLTAQIINDGSGDSPYRLSLTAKNTGAAGRVVFDAGSTSLGANTLIKAQDAAVFVGAAGSANPLLITASQNQIAGVINGVSINLNSASSSPVTLSVARNADAASTQLQSFTDGFNTLIDKITDLTKFDSTTNTKGTLLGDSTVEGIQQALYTAINSAIPDNGKYRTFADIGLTIGDSAKLVFDASKFSQAYATDPDGVQRLFTLLNTTTDATGKSTSTGTGLGYLLENQINKLIDPVSGTITQENQTIDTKTQGYQDRITSLNALISAKKTRLQLQFANMETILSQLQSQQSSITNLATSLSKSTTTS